MALAADDATRALPDLRQALNEWRDLQAPYEAARCRELMGAALRRLGDIDSAQVEARGGEGHVRRTRCHTRRTPPPYSPKQGPALPADLTEREVEVLRLLATGLSNASIASSLTLREKTVSRHLSNIFTKLGVNSRTAAAAFAFEHHLL